MNNSDTPTGGNGKKELKVTKTNEADDLLNKYFEELEKEGYGKIDIRALIFDVPEVSIKTLGGDEDEERQGLSDVINVLSSGQRTMELEEIANGLRASAKLADLEKVKAKTKALKDKRLKEKESQDKKKTSSGGTEKPENKER